MVKPTEYHRIPSLVNSLNPRQHGTHFREDFVASEPQSGVFDLRPGTLNGSGRIEHVAARFVAVTACWPSSLACT